MPIPVATHDLPFALDPVRHQQTQQRPDRIGQRNDEGIFQAGGDVDALGDQQGRHP
jgi:hypothetical protein